MQIKQILVHGAVSVLLVAVGLPVPFAYADVGDLDPSFADHGRQVAIPGARGTVRSVELPDTGGVFVGGGRIVLTQGRSGCTATATSFATRLGADGEGDPAPAGVTGVEAMDVAQQADGGIVGVGRTVRPVMFSIGGRCSIFDDKLAAFRLTADGSLDPGFGVDGLFHWDGRELSAKHLARSLLLDPDGRIVVAGTGLIAAGDTSESRQLVLRLLTDGSLDPTFGDGGVFLGPGSDFLADVRIARTQGGAYRLMSKRGGNCAVVGVTAAGVPDAAFGQAGVALVRPTGGNPVACTSLEALANGRLLLAGSAGVNGFVARLLEDGAPDPTFAPAASLTPATAITSGVDGGIYVAGSGPAGASIARLDATGALDASFGDSGYTWIDLPSAGPSVPIIRDMAIREDGSVVAAGGDANVGPFVVRLLGDAGGTSTGVVGFSIAAAAPQEEAGEAVIRVRRAGGKDGAVSVGYRTVADAEATADEDFTPTEGTLDWADGDRSDREIAVYIARDEGSPEGTETFHVALDDAQGGAGFGNQVATVSIQPDGAPGGQIQVYDIYGYGPGIAEADEISPAQIWLSRDYYRQGSVCVTVTTRSGTAIQGEDFIATNATQCWDDQDWDQKVVLIPTIQDGLAEAEETFTVELSNPTGGAILGKQAVATVMIFANAASEPPPPPPPDEPPPPDDDGGGGPAGVAELLALLGLLLARQGKRRATECAA